MTGHIRIESQGAVQIIRFNRAEKKNALTSGMYRDMTEALTSGESSPDVRVHLFLGSPGIFSAGNDIADFQKAGSPAADMEPVMRFLRAIAGAQKPMLAGVNGLAVGVGTTLLMHCDIVYASPESWFQTPFTALGLVPEAGSSLIGPRLMGHAFAFELLVAGERFTAEKARMAGLVNAIVPGDVLEAETLKAAERIAALPPDAVKLSKSLLKGDTSVVMGRIQDEAVLFGERLRSEEAQAAFRAFFTRH